MTNYLSSVAMCQLTHWLQLMSANFFLFYFDAEQEGKGAQLMEEEIANQSRSNCWLKHTRAHTKLSKRENFNRWWLHWKINNSEEASNLMLMLMWMPLSQALLILCKKARVNSVSVYLLKFTLWFMILSTLAEPLLKAQDYPVLEIQSSQRSRKLLLGAVVALCAMETWRQVERYIWNIWDGI